MYEDRLNAGNQSDNPIENLFKRSMGLGKTRKNLSEHLFELNNKAEDTADYLMSGLMASKDKFKVRARSKELTSFTDVNKLKQSLYSADIKATKALDRTLHTLGRAGGEFRFDSNTKALFFGSDKAGFSPIALQRKDGLAQIGFDTRGVRSALNLNTNAEVTFFDAYYKSLGRLDNVGSAVYNLGRFRKSTVGSLYTSTGADLTLGKMLGTSPEVRGLGNVLFAQSQSATAIAVGDSFTGQTPALFKAKSQFVEAGVQINMLTRSGFIPKDRPVLVSPNQSPTERFRELVELRKQYAKTIASEYSRLGVSGVSGFAKADYLVNEYDDMVLPNARALRGMFGSTHLPEQMMIKGAHQLLRVSELDEFQRSRLRPSDAFSFIDEGVSATRGSGLRIGVIDFDNDLYSRLHTQESGGILTAKGRRKFAKQLHTVTAKINIPDAEVGDLIGRALNVDLTDTTNFNQLTDREADELLDFIDSKSTQGLTPQQLRAKEVLGQRKTRAALKVALQNRDELASVRFEGGTLKLNYRTRSDYMPAASELVVGGRRITGINVAQEHALHRLTRQAAKQGIDVLVSADEFKKMYADEVFLDTFFDEARKTGLLDDVSKQMGIRTALTPINDKTRINIPLVTDRASAVEKAKGIVGEWSRSSNKRRQKLADRITHGQRITITGMEGVSGVRAYTTRGGMRSDFMMDINTMGPAKIKPAKLKMLATGSMALGYSDATRDIAFRTIYSQFLNKTGYSLKFNPRTLSFRSGSQLSNVVGALTDESFVPNSRYTVQLRDNEFFYKGKKLKNLSEVIGQDNVRYPKGIRKSDLKGTILDTKMPKNLFIDLGQDRAVAIGGETRNLRYLPVPRQLLGLNKGQEGRVVTSPKNPGYKFLQTLAIMQNEFSGSPDPVNARNMRLFAPGMGDTPGVSTVSEAVGNLVKALPRQLRGKTGKLEDMSTLLVPSGFAGRLIPQTSNYLTAKNFTDPDKAFDVFVSESDLQDLFRRKEDLDPSVIRRARAQIKNTGYTTVLLNADPTQRGEHMLTARLRMREGKAPMSKIGQTNLELHPVLLKMFERDVDRDRLSVFFIEAMSQGKNTRSQFDKRIERQKRKLKPYLNRFAGELLASTDSRTSVSIIDRLGLGKLTEEIVESFISQKSQAHFGYTITRTADRILDVAQAGNAADVDALRPTGRGRALIDELRRVYDPAEAGASRALAQNLFQGGVKKGQEAPLYDVAEALIDIRDRVRNNPAAYTRAGIIDQVTPAFEKYLGAVDNRDYMAILDSLKASGMSTEQMGYITQDLTRASSEEVARASRAGAAKLLAARYGVGAALYGLVRNKNVDALNVIEDQAYEGNNLIQKVLGPLRRRTGGPQGIGLATSTAADLAAAREASERAAKPAGSLTSQFLDFFKNAKGGRAFMLGLGAGAIGGMAIDDYFEEPQGAPLPPPMQTAGNSDYGPNAQMNTARLYSAPSAPAERSLMNMGMSSTIGDAAQVFGMSSLNISDNSSRMGANGMQVQLRNNYRSDF